MSEFEKRYTYCDVCGDQILITDCHHCDECGRTYCNDCEGGSVGMCELCEEELDEES